MSEFSGDQVHPATPARLEQARRDGNLAKSHELAAALQMLGAIVVSYLLFEPLGTWLSQSTIAIWSKKSTLVTVDSAQFSAQMTALIWSSFAVLMPILVLLMLFGIGSHWCQTGPIYLSSKAAPDLHRMSPTHWFSRLFSLRTLAFPLVGLPKAFLAVAVMIFSCWTNRQQFFLLGSFPADQMIHKLYELVLQTCLHVAIALFATSLLDYGIAWLSHQKKLRMTDQELRDELRMQNGDPQVTAQMQARRRRG